MPGNWTYEQVKAAANTPPFDTFSDDDCVILLNAQTVPIETDISTSLIRNLLAETSEQALGTISLIADGITATLSAGPAMAVYCRTFMELLNHNDTLPGVDPAGWAQTQTLFGNMEGIGVISNSTCYELTRLQLPDVNVWQPPLTLYDVNVARLYY